MSQIVIQVENLWKEYRLGVVNHHTLALDLQSWWARVRRREDPNSIVGKGGSPQRGSERFWALKDVCFEVRQGDVLGIIGRNGAGKSTLLKILSQVTAPTKGEVRFKGRIASLLEVGTGFHPELTGRENVFLNGAIMGMSKSDIRSRFDEIVDFAEVGAFIDTPVKRYSSGMYVRLAFAVAAHLEPEILVVDEVLAVGDAQFQRKCLGKMEAAGKEGRTVLFVSHNMTALQRLCQKALWLEAGQVLQQGDATSLVAAYLRRCCEFSSRKVWEDSGEAPGNERAALRSVTLLDIAGNVLDLGDLSQPVVVEVEYAVHRPGTVLNLSLSLYSQEDVYVLASPSSTDPNWFMKTHPAGTFKSRCTIPGDVLNEGRYSLTVLLVEDGVHLIGVADRVVSMDMVDSGSTRGSFFGTWGGVVRPSLCWDTQMTAGATGG